MKIYFENFFNYMPDEIKLLKFLSKNMASPGAIFVVILFCWTIVIALDNFLEKGIPDVYFRWVLYLLFILTSILIFLFYKYSLPKNKKGEVGIVIGIITYNDEQKEKLNNFFYKKLISLAESNKTIPLNLITLHNHQAEYLRKVHKDWHSTQRDGKDFGKWKKLKKKIGADFYILGTMCEGIDVKDSHYIEIDAIVPRPIIPRNIEQAFNRQFFKFWEHEIKIDKGGEVSGLQMSASKLYQLSQYIMGGVALLVGNVETAHRFHINVYREVCGQRDEFERLLFKDLQILLGQECFFLAGYFYNNDKLDQALEYVNKYLTYEGQKYLGLLLKSNINFAKGLPEEALKNVIEAKTCILGEDGTWRYNEAFLLMYLGNFPLATSIYRKISQKTFSGEELILDQVLDFNKNFVKKHPDKIIIYYILGYLYYKKKNNPKVAVGYFTEFLNNADAGKYAFLRRKAQVFNEEALLKL